ncbi:MAG: polar amino acid transporter [Hyphomicrobiales bacterium]|nr:polar amino acid transporter [Hyphomicrobiales bacterium]
MHNRRIACLSSFAAAFAILGLVGGMVTASLADELVVGADYGSNPYIIASPDGTVTGFNADLATEVAKRMGKSGVKIVDQQFAGIFAGLEAHKYEFIIAPVTLTQERSEAMLFIEGFVATDLQFLTRKGKAIDGLEALSGKSIAVNNGSAQEQYLESIRAKYGFTINKYGKNADAFQAVLSGRDDAAISGDGNVMYAAAQNPQLEASYRVSTGNVFSWAFRKDDEATRTKVERIMECMKLDGTVSKVYAKWFGAPPAANSPSMTVSAGIGQPGRANFVADYKAPNCGT